MYQNEKGTLSICKIRLNYKIIHRILGTNKLLFFAKKKDNPFCSISNFEPESLEHQFYYCHYIKEIREKVEKWKKKRISKNVNLDSIPDKESKCCVEFNCLMYQMIYIPTTLLFSIILSIQCIITMLLRSTYMSKIC